MIDFDSNSNNHLSILFFGGSLKEEIIVPETNEDGSPKLFKSGQKIGQIRTKKVQKDVKIQGLGLQPSRAWETKKEGIYQTNEQVLNALIKEDSEGAKLAELLLQIRGLRKELSTYYVGIEGLMYIDSTVHATFHHAQTETGRLSSSNPNVQNVPS